MKLFKTALLFILLAGSNAAMAEQTQIEYAYEDPIVAFHLARDLTGYIKIRIGGCDSCKVKMFKITPDVKAELDGKEVPLSNYISSAKKPTSAHFSIKTKKMTRLVWYSHH